jgi:uncharacterized peroxidase-related enzyme
MNRITALDPAQTTGKAKTLFDGVQAKLGAVPNLLRTIGNSPAALEGYLNLSGALAGGKLSAAEREQIALAVAETNLCSYCLSAHSFIGDKVGLSADDIANARSATAADAKTDAVLKFARSVVVNRGEVHDSDLNAARDAGLNEEDLIETVANVSLNILTNYVNHVAHTTIDFPEVKPGEVEVAAAN